MKKLNQKGFGIVESLLIFVIVAIICGAGFYVYRSNKNTPENAKSDSQAVEDEKTESAPAAPVEKDEYAGWKTYNETKFSFSFKYPSNWTVKEVDNYGYNSPEVYDQSNKNIIIFNQGGVGCQSEVDSSDDFSVGGKKVTLAHSCFYLFKMTTDKGSQEVLLDVKSNYANMSDLKKLLGSLTNITSASDN